MARINVPFVVEKQHITQPTQVVLMSGGHNYFYATFKLCDTWEDISHIKAVFCRGNMSILMSLTEGTDCLECEIPWEVMVDKGVFEVGIFGDDRLLTNLAYVKVGQGCVTEGDEPKPPTPDWFNEIEKKIDDLPGGSSGEIDEEQIKQIVDDELTRASFIVNVVIDEELNVDEEFNATADKTYNDIVSAYNEGKRVVIMVDDRHGQGQACISDIHITSGYCEFSGVTQGMYVRFECYPNNTWSVRVFEIPDKTYLESYVDAKFVPFTITINSDNVGNRTYLDIVRAIDSHETINIYHEMSGITWDVIGIQKQADRVLIGCHFDYTTLWLWCTSENEWGALSKEYASKSEIGDIDTALDTIIEIQNTLIGGDGE